MSHIAPDTELALITTLLGRPPRCDVEVVRRNRDGVPVVLRNPPFLDDGTPMPTRYWLCGPAEVAAVSRLESDGGVHRVEDLIDPIEVAAAHAAYAAERDAEIPDDHDGPVPRGGVGGTRTGLKCLHAHFAHHLAGGDDAVGRWVATQLEATGDSTLVTQPSTDPGRS